MLFIRWLYLFDIGENRKNLTPALDFPIISLQPMTAQTTGIMIN